MLFPLRYRLEGRESVKIIERAIEKRSYESMYKTILKNEAKRLRATTLLLQSWKGDNPKGSNREKSNIAITILERVTVKE